MIDRYPAGVRGVMGTRPPVVAPPEVSLVCGVLGGCNSCDLASSTVFTFSTFKKPVSVSINTECKERPPASAQLPPCRAARNSAVQQQLDEYRFTRYNKRADQIRDSSDK